MKYFLESSSHMIVHKCKHLSKQLLICVRVKMFSEGEVKSNFVILGVWNSHYFCNFI